MPLDIATRLIKMSELHPCDSKIGRTIVHLPYAPIYQWGYGRMDASTPVLGLATSAVTSCICVVLHCPTTRRTVLAHCNKDTVMTNSFVPVVDWIIGGDGKTRWSASDREDWFNGKGAKKHGTVVDAAVLRGCSHEYPQSVYLQHDRWMSNFRQFLSSASVSRMFRVASCLDAPEVLTCASVLVDKTTARITYLTLESGTPFKFISITNPHLKRQYSNAQQMQDLFVGISLSQRIPSEIVELHLQYDVASYKRAIPLPDEIRQLLRLMPAPAADQSHLLRTLNVSHDWTLNSNPLAWLTRQSFEVSMAAGRPCELCGDVGSLKCSSCKGAWYCGENHQLQDWKAHRVWCKLHPAPAK
ncbi:hypothetical protein C8R43DRAFT_1073186 [Mycena crocata]|nr:hypothetical protein C8R43DRAFT_1073186 [Mycena crocata]